VHPTPFLHKQFYVTFPVPWCGSSPPGTGPTTLRIGPKPGDETGCGLALATIPRISGGVETLALTIFPLTISPSRGILWAGI